MSENVILSEINETNSNYSGGKPETSVKGKAYRARAVIKSMKSTSGVDLDGNYIGKLRTSYHVRDPVYIGINYYIRLSKLFSKIKCMKVRPKLCFTQFNLIRFNQISRRNNSVYSLLSIFQIIRLNACFNQ